MECNGGQNSAPEVQAAIVTGAATTEAISGGSGAAGVLHVLRRDHDVPLAVVDRTGRLLGAEGVELTGDQLRAVAWRAERVASAHRVERSSGDQDLQLERLVSDQRPDGEHEATCPAPPPTPGADGSPEIAQSRGATT